MPRIAALLLLCLTLCACPTIRIDRVNEGANVQPLPQTFAVGKTSLSDVLAVYGAPADVADLNGHFAIRYERSFYRGGQLSFSIPLNDVLKVSPAFDAAGNLQRYDSAIFIFTPECLLSGMSYERGSTHPLWNAYWK